MIFCQRCKLGNPIDAEFCESCGTRLLIIARPRNLPPHGDIPERTLEEHLLERISALEAAVARANERFEQLLELAQQQATGSFYDHMMVEALSDILAENQALDRNELDHRWRTRVAQHHEETIERERMDERCSLILSHYRGQEREDFAGLVVEGTSLISAGYLRRGLRVLENALELDPQNPELNFAAGEYYFHLNDSSAAVDHLSLTLKEVANHFGARLLLGLLIADDGDTATAREHLNHALTIDQYSFAAHYGLGRILTREGKHSEALSHLKRALALQPTPEMHYLVGRAYWELGRGDQALKHLQKAVRLDPRFDAAIYNLGLIYWQTNRPSEAREHFRAAYEINPRDSHYRVALRAQAGDELPKPPAPGERTLIRRRKTRNNEARFVELLWRDLNTFTPVPVSSRKKS
jgi:tetratricopeptide (TPR) repeat protein